MNLPFFLVIRRVPSLWLSNKVLWSAGMIDNNELAEKFATVIEDHDKSFYNNKQKENIHIGIIAGELASIFTMAFLSLAAGFLGLDEKRCSGIFFFEYA